MLAQRDRQVQAHGHVMILGAGHREDLAVDEVVPFVLKRLPGKVLFGRHRRVSDRQAHRGSSDRCRAAARGRCAGRRNYRHCEAAHWHSIATATAAPTPWDERSPSPTSTVPPTSSEKLPATTSTSTSPA